MLVPCTPLLSADFCQASWSCVQLGTPLTPVHLSCVCCDLISALPYALQMPGRAAVEAGEDYGFSLGAV